MRGADPRRPLPGRPGLRPGPGRGSRLPGLLAFLGLLAALLGDGTAKISADEGGGAWLDQPLAPWTRPGEGVPPAPTPVGEAVTAARCARQVRPPRSGIDRIVADAGWTLFGPAQVFGDVYVLSGMAGVDGMCRPLGYQVFVFVADRFAGTVSPRPMDSRTDGAETAVWLFSADQVSARFSRYGPGDPLCCPSRTSVVGYEVWRGPSGGLLVPTSVTSEPAAP